MVEDKDYVTFMNEVVFILTAKFILFAWLTTGRASRQLSERYGANRCASFRQFDMADGLNRIFLFALRTIRNQFANKGVL